MWFNKKKTINQDLINKEADQFALRFNQGNPEANLRGMLSGISQGSAGVTVNNKTALNCVAVYACVKAISETMGSLPLPLYRRLTRGRDKATDNPWWQIFNIAPNDLMDSGQWIEAGIAHCLTWGNWYNEKEYYGNGDIKACHLLPPNKVTPEFTKSGNLVYKVEGSTVAIPAEKMFVVNGLGFDGLKGYSPITMGKNAIGLAMATELFGSTWFGNGSRGQGIVTSPKEMSDVAQANLRRQIESVHQGPENAHRLLILDDGMTFETIGVPPEDAQFLQTRQFQLTEICRLFRISPVVVQDLSRSTFSNNEQEMTSFVVHTLRPWAKRMERAIHRQCLTDDDRQEFYVEMNFNDLLRGDLAARNAAYAIGRQWGWLSANDICEMENRNPLPGEQGDVYLFPTNYVSGEQFVAPPEAPQPEQPQPPALPAPEADNSQDTPAEDNAAQADPEAVKASLDCVRDNLDRMVRREAAYFRKAAAKPAEFLRMLEMYQGNEPASITRAMGPSVKSYAALTGINPPDIAGELVGSAANELLELSGSVSASDLPKAVEQWLETRGGFASEIISRLDTYKNEDTN